MCCRMWCFTAVTSVVRTQYFVVERTKPCQGCFVSLQERSVCQRDGSRHGGQLLRALRHLRRVLILDTRRISTQLRVDVRQDDKDVRGRALHININIIHGNLLLTSSVFDNARAKA